MKNIVGIICAIAMILIMIFGFSNFVHTSNSDYLRIHITANSNEMVDQNIKYKIKDEIVEYLIPYLSECKSQQDAYKIVESKAYEIETLTNRILKSNGLSYNAIVKLGEEDFPNRSYDGFVLEEGFYDALIIDLGEAKGDNWWCVVYPPLCFSNPKTSNNVKYKSKIVEIINGFFAK